MAHPLMSFPMVLWEIQNAYSVKKQSSSTFAFLGENWKLQFNHSSSIRGQFIQFFFKRIEPDRKIDYVLCAKTSLVANNSPYNYETHINIDTSSAKEWCVWDEDMQKIKSCVGDSPLMVFFSIQPKVGWKKTLHENADKGMKLSEDGADIDSLREDFGNLFDKHVGADVIFNCRGEKICARRTVVSSRCRVLAAMFQTDMSESREGVIHITDTEPLILRVFLRYLYTGDLPRLSLGSAMKLHFLADKYGMDILRKNCAFFMMNSLEADTSEETSESNSEENLTMKIRSRLKNIKEVLGTDTWKYMNEEQLKISLDAFHILVKYFYSELNTKQGNDITLLNQDLQRKRIKLIKSEYEE